MNISVFDLFKIGIGPSSSHTVGPMYASKQFLFNCMEKFPLEKITSLKVELFGSLALTGKGHGTDKAVLMGLEGNEPASVDTEQIPSRLDRIHKTKTLSLMNEHSIHFEEKNSLIFNNDDFLPHHSNGMHFIVFDADHNMLHEEDFYSIGGGFILNSEEIKNEVLSSEEDSVFDKYTEQVIMTCLSSLSAEDFTAVLVSGILDDDDNEVPENPDTEPGFDRNQTFPDELAPDLVSNPAFADPGIQIIVSPGIVDGYLWEGTVSGSGMPPDIATFIFGCAGSFETVTANIFGACDFSNPTIALIDDAGNFSATIAEPPPTSPGGSCLLITTDPDDNPDTDDGPGAVVCTR